jgi:hypothetical protein
VPRYPVMVGERAPDTARDTPPLAPWVITQYLVRPRALAICLCSSSVTPYRSDDSIECVQLAGISPFLAGDCQCRAAVLLEDIRPQRP